MLLSLHTLLQTFTFALLALVALVGAPATAKGDTYLLGAGRGDITGPVVEVPLSGYALLDQKGSGVRQRLYARPFIIGDAAGADRVQYVVIDTMGGDTAIVSGVTEEMRKW
jgi:neutral ceramidase